MGAKAYLSGPGVRGGRAARHHGAMTAISDVPTPSGPGRLHADVPAGAVAVLVLGGGASGVIDSADLLALARELPGRGIGVVRYELPWRVAGARVAPRPPASDPLWDAGLDAVRAAHPGMPVLTGGRSAGARIACRTHALDVMGVVALAFPLHPPGKPEASRAGELAGVAGPVLLVSGARDPFGSPDELRAAVASGQAGERELVIVAGATHSFPARTTGAVVDAVEAFVLRLTSPRRGR